MKKLFCFLFLFIIVNLAAIAQHEPQFTFNKVTRLVVNPGFAGHDGLVNGAILNRSQWVGFIGAPQTRLFSVGAATQLFGIPSGVGLNFISDEAGFEKNISVSIDYAYRKKTGLGMLGIGASVGFFNKAVNGDWKTGRPVGDQWGDPGGDPNVPQGDVSAVALDLGLGVFLNAEDYYLGVSVTHLNQPSFIYADQASDYLARIFYVSGGYNIGLSDPLFELQPSLLVKSDLATYQADVTAELVYKKRYSAGLNYRVDEGVGVLLGFEMLNGIRVGYAYDIILSAISGYTGGTHEVYLGYSFDLGKNRNKKYKSVRFL